MLINSSLFLFAFLPLALFIYYVCFRKVGVQAKNFLLFFISLGFLYLIDPFLCGLLLIMTVLNVLVSRILYNRQSVILLACGILGNAAVFIIYQVLPALRGNVQTKILYAVVPVTMLIFTLHAISLLISCYRHTINYEKGLFKNGLYLLFFPLLSAGPITTYDHFISQTLHRSFQFEDLSRGIQLFITGLGKVVILGQTLSYITKTAFTVSPNITFSFAWFGLICFVIQVYYELSGLSDMAIGLSKMFGFRIAVNFQYPLMGIGFTSFTHRFNSSVQQYVSKVFFRGDTKSGAPKYLAPLFTAFFFALYFGLSWNLLIVFAIFALMLLFETFASPLFSQMDKRARVIIRPVLYYPFLLLAFVFLGTKSPADALSYLHLLVSPLASNLNFTSGTMFLLEHFWFLCIALVGIFPAARAIKLALYKYKIALYLYPVAYILLLLVCVMYFSNGIYRPFFL